MVSQLLPPWEAWWYKTVAHTTDLNYKTTSFMLHCLRELLSARFSSFSLKQWIRWGQGYPHLLLPPSMLYATKLLKRRNGTTCNCCQKGPIAPAPAKSSPVSPARLLYVPIYHHVSRRQVRGVVEQLHTMRGVTAMPQPLVEPRRAGQAGARRGRSSSSYARCLLVLAATLCLAAGPTQAAAFTHTAENERVSGKGREKGEGKEGLRR